MCVCVFARTLSICCCRFVGAFAAVSAGTIDVRDTDTDTDADADDFDAVVNFVNQDDNAFADASTANVI